MQYTAAMQHTAASISSDINLQQGPAPAVMARNRKHPGADAGLVPELGHGLPGGEKDLLGDVFDVANRATKHVHAETHYHTLVGTHQYLEGNGELVVCRRPVSLSRQVLPLTDVRHDHVIPY